MVTWFYFIVFLHALIMAGSILLRNKNVDTLLVLFSIVVTINCMGRYMLASAESIEMAIWANKFVCRRLFCSASDSVCVGKTV